MRAVRQAWLTVAVGALMVVLGLVVTLVGQVRALGSPLVIVGAVVAALGIAGVVRQRGTRR